MLSNRTITREEFVELIRPWFEAVGTTPEDGISLAVDPDGIKVTVFRKHDGKRVIGHREFIKDVYYVAVGDPACDDPDSLCSPRKSDVPE